MSVRYWRSVAESSTTRMFLIGMARHLSGCGEGPVDVLVHGGDEPLAGKRLGEVAVRAGEPAARAVEDAVLAGEHDDRRGLQRRVLLDERAGLVAVEAGHHDVHEDHLRLVIADLRESVEAV